MDCAAVDAEFPEVLASRGRGWVREVQDFKALGSIDDEESLRPGMPGCNFRPLLVIPTSVVGAEVFKADIRLGTDAEYRGEYMFNEHVEIVRVPRSHFVHAAQEAVVKAFTCCVV